MEDTDNTAVAPLDPEVARVLQHNPEAAHFVATLARGASLGDAVRDHFADMLARQDATPQPDHAPVPQPAPLPPQATPAPQQPMFSPVGSAAPVIDDNDDDDDDPDHFLGISLSSVWD